MSRERSDHDPPPGLRSPLYGTATFTTLSNSSRPTTPVPMSPSAYSSRLSYPTSSRSRSVTPVGSEDRDMRRLVLSPTPSSFDSRRNSSASETEESYTHDGDNSFDETEEVEATLIAEHVDDEEEWSTGYSSSAHSGSYGTGTYSGSQTTQPLNFDRERRALSIISERTEQQSITGGGLFSTLLSRPTSFLSNAAASSAEVFRRSLYGQPTSPLSTSPRSSASSLPAIRSDSRPATPDRVFRPAPPTGRRVGDLIATFESNTDSPTLRPLGPRSPSPYSSSRPSSPLKPSYSRTTTGVGLGIPPVTPTQTMSSLLSPPMTRTASSEATRSPFSSVRNIVTAWKERTPTRGTSTAASSTVSGTRLPFSVGESVFSLRRRGAIAGRVGQRAANEPPPYEEFGGNGNGNSESGRSIERSTSRRSVATLQSESGFSSNWDMSELSSLIRGNEEALRSGYLWYLNVHAPPPYLWQRCQAILYPSTLVLTWLAPGGGRGVVTLDLINCNEIRSVPAPSHPSARDDVGTIAARLQVDMARRGEQELEYDLLNMLYPFQLIYSDGVERLGTESAAERVRWVGAIWEAIDRSSTIPDRSLTGSPTGSIRTIRSFQSSIRSGSSNGSGDGSASTTFVPNLDSIPDLPDFGDSSTFTQTESRTGTYTAVGSRVRSSDDGAISSRGFLHPLDSRGISRSGSLRRTSSLTDLDARYAGIIDFGDSAGRTRDGLSSQGSFSARWSGTRSDYTSSDAGDSVSQVGGVRRVPASTFYSLSSGSSSAGSSFRTATSVPLLEPPLRSPVYSEGTEIVASTLSLRRPDSASLLGDSHSGSAMSPVDILSPTSGASSGVIARRTASPTRTYSSYTGSTRTPYTSTTGLSRRSEVRRRTPRTSSRTYSSPRTVSSGTGIPSESSDKENEPEESEGQMTRKTRSEGSSAGNGSSDWTSLDTRSYTTTSYDYSRLPSTRASTESEQYTESESEPPLDREPESDSDDVFLTPTPSSRASTSYHSAQSPPGTPTPSIPSISTAYDTAEPAPSSTAFDTAELCPSTPLSTDYTTAGVCPSTPPSTGYTTAELCPSSPPSTDYLSAECRCIPSEPSLRTEISSLSPTPSISEILSEKQVEDVASLYSPSEVPTIPSIIEEAEVPLPSEDDESLLADESVREQSLSERAPSTPTSGSAVALSSSLPPPSPVYEVPSRLSLLSSASESTIPPSPVIEFASGPSLLPSVASSVAESVVPQSPPSGGSLLSSVSMTASEAGVLHSPPSAPSLLSSIPMSGSQPAMPRTPPSDPSLLSSVSMTASEPVVPHAPPSGLSLLSSASSIGESPIQFVSPPESSLLSSMSSASAETLSLLTPSSESSVTPIQSSLTLESRTPSDLTQSPSVRPISLARSPSVQPISLSQSPSVRPISLTLDSLPSYISTPSSPSSATELSVHTESVLTPKSKSVYVPSHTSAPSEPTVSEYDSSILAPSPSMQSIPTPEPVDVSFETSFFRPSGSEVFSEQELSPFWPKGQSMSDKSTATPSSTSVTTLSSGQTVTVTRTPSTISTVSVESYRSSILYPKSIWEEELSSPSTEPSLLTSRPTTPRALSPRTIPIPHSPIPTASLSTPEGTASVSLSSPRSERPSIHSLTTVESEIPPEDPFERLFNLLDDLDMKREGENQDLKDHMRDLEDALRDLADHIKKPPVPVKDRSVGRLTPIPAVRPAGPREIFLSPPPSRPSPTYAPSSLSGSMSYLPSAHSDDDLLEDYMSEATYPELPRSPSSPSESSPPTSPPSSTTPSSPTPSTATDATARPISDHVTPALDGLRDLLEDLRRQVQALWDGQLGTNRMLDDLVDRRLPPLRNDELNERLHNIENTLGNILRDLARGVPIEESDQSPSELSSDTASALRRYIDRLRDARGREPQLHMPTPVRPPTTSVDAEWLRFLSEAPTVPEQLVQGPPPLVPLVRRTARPPRTSSVTPPLASILSPSRPLTAPLGRSERLRYDDLPRPRRRRPWTGPIIGQGIRPITPVSELSTFYDPRIPPVSQRALRRPEDDIDFLRHVNGLRQGRNGGDGFYQDPRRTQPIVTEDRPVRPPERPDTAPAAVPISETFYPGGRPRREDQTLADAGAPGVGPRPTTGQIPQQPIFAPIMSGQLPADIPPFPEMLDLLRQNRLAQTASIDQQREIMRYMRSLNDWLGRDVRDRQNEMQAISARVDALRNDLARMGPIGGMPVPQVQGSQAAGPTYIVPPMSGVQPGVVVPPGMPQPQIPFSPSLLPSGFQQGRPGVYPGVIPTGYDPAVTPPFIPPFGPTTGLSGRVVPNFNQYTPRPGVIPGSMMQDPGMGPHSERPFIPPPMQPPQIIVQQPMGPSMGPSMMSAGIPVEMSDGTSTQSPTMSSVSDQVIHHLHHTVPSEQPVPPPMVERMEDAPLTHGPLHPSLGIPVQPSMVPAPPPPQTIIVGQQPMPQFAPSQQPPTQVIISSPRPHSERSRSGSPPHQTIVLPDHSRRTRSRSSSSSRGRVIVVPTQQGGVAPTAPVVMMPDTSRPRSRSRSRSSSRGRVVVVPSHRPHSREREPHVVMVPTDGRTAPHTFTEGDYGSRHTPQTVFLPSRHSPSPPQVVIQQPPEHAQPPVFLQQPQTGYAPSQAPPVVIQQPSGHMPSRGERPIIIEGGGSGRSPSPPVIIRQQSGRGYSPSRHSHRSPSSHRPTYVLAPSGRPEELGDEGQRVLRRRPQSQSPTHIQVVSPSSRGRSPSRRSEYQTDQHSRSRSPRTHRRDEMPTQILYPSHARTPSSRYHEVPEDAPSITRTSRRAHSPEYVEGDAGGGHHRTPSRRSPLLDDTGRSYRTPSRSERPLEEVGGHFRTPSRHDFPPEELAGLGRTLSRRTEQADRPHYTPSAASRPLEAERLGRTSSRRTGTRITRSQSPISEEDAGAPRPVRVRSRSPTIIPMSPPVSTTVPVRPPPSGPTAVPTYGGPETIGRESPPPLVIRRTPSPSPMMPHEHRALQPERTPAPSEFQLPEPSTPYLPTAHPTEARYSPPLSARDEHYEADPTHARVPSGHAPIPPPIDRPVSPRTAIEQAVRTARDGVPVVPYIPSQRPVPTDYEQSMMPPTIQEEAVPTVSRIPQTPYTATMPPPRMPSVPPPQAPSGPGDLTFYDNMNERAQRLEEHEQRLHDLERAAEEAEERREQYFRAHEEERERIFEDHEEKRDQEAAVRRDEIYDTLLEKLPVAPPGPSVPPVEIGEGGLSGEAPLVEGDEAESRTPSIASSEPRPVPEPIGPVVTAIDPAMQEQMQGLMDMMRQCMAESNEAKAAAAMRQEEIDAAVAQARQECEEHLRSKDEEIARGREDLARVLEDLNRTREELELERGQRRNEELERLEMERQSVSDRHEAVLSQLNDITQLVHGQQEEMNSKRELMESRWNEKQGRREEKQARHDELYQLIQTILQDRERERMERDAEREANANRPNIEQVLEMLREQSERMQTSIDGLAEAWRADSARQHSETIEAVRATAQEMVPYNLTGYLDEFSRALAGEVRTLIGEVGRLHEQKRTLQHGIAELFHMQSQYGPGGQFEPDWHASQGPLAPPPPGPDMPPPPPEEPHAPPPARPAWRTVQQRQPRRQRTRKGDQPPPPPPTEPEPVPQDRQQSWATWQPNPAFQPTPPPANSSPLLVPPQGPQGLFGPRSPRNTQHFG